MLAHRLALLCLTACFACGPSKGRPTTQWPSTPSRPCNTPDTGLAEPSEIDYDPGGRDPCAFGLPEFYPDEEMGSANGPPTPPEGTGPDQAPAIRMVLTDPEIAGRPYVVRAEVVHDTGLEYVEFAWGNGKKWFWEFKCGEAPPPGVEATCTRVDYAYILTVVPPPGFANIGVEARARDGGSAAKTIGAEFHRCPR